MAKLSPYPQDDAVDTLQYLIIPEPQYPVPLGLEVTVAICVANGPGMLTSIRLHDQL